MTPSERLLEFLLDDDTLREWVNDTMKAYIEADYHMDAGLATLRLAMLRHLAAEIEEARLEMSHQLVTLHLEHNPGLPPGETIVRVGDASFVTPNMPESVTP